MSTPSAINIDDLTPVGEPIEPGSYTARLVQADGKDSKAGKPMVVAEYEIIDGESKAGNDQSGKTISLYHSLHVAEKDGKKFAGGIMDMKRIFAAIGQSLPAGYPFPLHAATAAALYAKKVAGKDVRLTVTVEKRRDDPDKTSTRGHVTGLAGGVATAVSENDTASFAGLDG